MTGIADRKDQHLDVVLSGRGQGPAATGLDAVRFRHVALPEIALGDVDLSTTFLGRRLGAPLLVSAMTGGPARACAINRALAAACGRLRLPLAVGSQRVALEGGGDGGLGRDLRAALGDVPLLANLGAAQLNLGYGLAEARRAVDMIEADALVLHLNPLQEAVQEGGDGDWRGLLGRIGSLARALPVPLVAKEVGAGLSGPVARRLVDAGVAVLDVAGAGGTSWALVEAERARSPRAAAVARAFAGWGIPTAQAIAEVRRACPGAVVIGSGGIRDGLDAARALRLGADLAGQAAGVLAAAAEGEEAVTEALEVAIAQLRVACFCTGSPDLAALKAAELL